MNELSQAGLRIAKQVASAYLDYPHLHAVIVGGSVSRGVADPYSDLDMIIFWFQPPTIGERKQAIGRIGGELWAFDREPGSEHIGLKEIEIGGTHYVGTAMLSTHHMMVSAFDACLADVIDQMDTSPEKQNLISAIQNAAILYGEELVHSWQQLRQLIDEVIDLVETYLPEVNQRSLFKEHPEINISWAKQRWKTEPPYTLIENVRKENPAP